MTAEGSYARFYALLKRLPGADKDTLVEQFTNGRTTHLHLMAAPEYDAMCRAMERVAVDDERQKARREALRKARSSALHQMQIWGVDTADWTRVNAFCADRRIAGVEFRRLDIEGLDRLTTKLRAMIRKRELRERKARIDN